MYLQVEADTIFKTSTRQAAELPEGEKLKVDKGEVFDVVEHHSEHLHVGFTLVRAPRKEENRLTWFAYKPDIKVFGAMEQRYDEAPAPAKPEDRGPVITIPGYGQVYLNDPLPGCHNFFWYEATRNGERIPLQKANADAIIRVGQNLEQARDKLGKPFIITSWYRPPKINRQVGGASRSRHVIGDAADIKVPGMSPRQVYNALDNFWGNRGGMGVYNWGCHFDTRGYAARW